MSTLASADDVEIYLQEPPEPVPPNVLFVLDESGSMSSGRPSRRDRLEEAMRTLINDPDMGNVNAALLGYTTRWNNNGPLYLRAHSGNFSIIEDNQTTFLNAADNLQTISYTPTVKAMEAAVNWFRRDRTFVDSNGFTTVSPIDGIPQDNWCRPNHMVVLTDGRPNSNSPTSGQAYGLTSYEGVNCVSNATSNWQNGRCAAEIADWAYNTDMETGDGWNEVQNIVTHTIGFDTNDPAIENFMENIAAEGGGSYYPATSVSDLVSAFTSIVETAQQAIPYAYTAPVVPFNQDNAAVSGDRIYVPTLVPAAEIFWRGNLKSYTISTSLSAGATPIVITDADGDPIHNDSYEFISSRDHWNSTGEDGGDPLVGGAAEKMTAGGFRNLYTNTNPSAALSHASNRVHRDNDLVTHALLGVADGDDARREALLNWISWDPTLTGEASHEGEMGAPLHTQPAVMEYNSGDVIFLPTTEGVLEAIDANTGEELWAFMPSDLLGGIQTIFNNNPSTIPYYGLDGPLTVYETQGRKMAIVGMRRGGRNYYMLDITDRENPSFVTTVNAASGLSRLGQTWSKPLFVTMEIGGGSAREVLVFGGGYDPDQDNVTTNRANDDEGNAIYIIDARDGSLVTTISSDGSANLTIGDMRNSIAGNLLPVDINANNVIDRLYATDVGGRVIRVDIPDSEFADTSMAGGIIADIYAPGELRKFFNTPEVGYYNIGSTQYLAILVGSGNRSNPLDVTVTDRFYMIKDPGVWTKPITYVTVAHDELYDATANLVQDGTAEQQGAARNSLALLKGWFIDLGYSEKSYSKAVLYDYLVLFTTFSAERSAELAACEARGASGVGRAYAVNMRDGSAVIDGFGGSFGDLDRNDRTKVLSMLGIPPSPALVFPEGEQAATLGNVVKALVGLEEVAEWPERLRPISWEEVIE
ncbi:MAG: VWA domain-containing protein [Candidatus Thiodiazotropha sp. (ex Clathrolucina costata)]|nr:VWA domain-containing protein [Candidatus Thiodiazotropha taylori]